MRATEIIERLAAHRATRAHQQEILDRPVTTTSAVADPTLNGLKRGDRRVRIKNRVIKPATCWPIERPWIKEEARCAAVMQVTRDQIHFVTDNGREPGGCPTILK